LPDKHVITRVFEVAAGLFAPGQLGELTRYVPFDLVDRVLAGYPAVKQTRVRALPRRVVVYFVLALALFEDCSYRAVWGKLTASLEQVAPVRPAASSLCRARARLGPGPIKALFTQVSGVLGQHGSPAVYRHGYRTVAIDGTHLQLPDRAAITARYAKRRNPARATGYPLLRLVCLVETGTRALIGAVFGPETLAETGYAQQLAGNLTREMLVLADSYFDKFPLLSVLHEHAGAFLVRATASRRPAREQTLADGSYLTTLRGKRPPGGGSIPTLPARVIEAYLTVRRADGVIRTEPWRLITTLTDPIQHPAADLIALYHERWQAETAYAQLKTILLEGRVLRSRTEAMIEQELWGILTVYQLLVHAVTAAAQTGGIDTDRLSYSIALHTARDQTIRAAEIVAQSDQPPTAITRDLLAAPHPSPRQRVRARIVKTISKYISNHGKQPAKTQHYTLDVTITLFTTRMPARPRT
jgi:Insertion element 4 transposase N-terminal/Transposase DDE domain